jgi:hypothetical protein
VDLPGGGKHFYKGPRGHEQVTTVAASYKGRNSKTKKMKKTTAVTEKSEKGKKISSDSSISSSFPQKRKTDDLDRS